MRKNFSKLKCLRCRIPLRFDGVGRPRVYCDSCNLLISREQSLDYRIRNRKFINKRHQELRLLYPEREKRYYKKYHRRRVALKRQIEDAIFDDVLKHPRKWLNMSKK